MIKQTWMMKRTLAKSDMMERKQSCDNSSKEPHVSAKEPYISAKYSFARVPFAQLSMRTEKVDLCYNCVQKYIYLFRNTYMVFFFNIFCVPQVGPKSPSSQRVFLCNTRKGCINRRFCKISLHICTQKSPIKCIRALYSG